MTRSVLVLAALAAALSSVAPAAAQEIAGTWVLVRDSDGQTPKKGATVTITFRGGTTGALAMSAVQPGETVTDAGRYTIAGTRITIAFDEMEWGARSKPYTLDGCTLTLPFKAFGGSGTSTWTKKGCTAPAVSTRSLAKSGGGGGTGAGNGGGGAGQGGGQGGGKAPGPGPGPSPSPSPSPAPNPAPDPSPDPGPGKVIDGRCRCRDKDYLKRRLQVVTRALNADMALALEYEAKGTAYSEAEAQDAESRVQWSIDNPDDGQPFRPTAPGETGSAADQGKAKPRPAAWTNGGDCGITVRNANTCQDAVLRTHELVHQYECRTYHADDPLPAPWGSMAPGRHGDYKSAKTMAQFLQEESRAYAAEKAYIENELRLLKQCREWRCDDGETYKTQEECERSCRAGLGRTIMPFGHRCKKVESRSENPPL